MDTKNELITLHCTIWYHFLGHPVFYHFYGWSFEKSGSPVRDRRNAVYRSGAVIFFVFAAFFSLHSFHAHVLMLVR